MQKRETVWVLKWARKIEQATQASAVILIPSFILLFVVDNRPFHSSWKVTKPLHETETKVDLAQLEKWK